MSHSDDDEMSRYMSHSDEEKMSHSDDAEMSDYENDTPAENDSALPSDDERARSDSSGGSESGVSSAANHTDTDNAESGDTDTEEPRAWYYNIEMETEEPPITKAEAKVAKIAFQHKLSNSQASAMMGWGNDRIRYIPDLYFNVTFRSSVMLHFVRQGTRIGGARRGWRGFCQTAKESAA